MKRTHTNNEVTDDEISKSQIKREAEVLKKLGRELLLLSKKQLAKIPGSDALFLGIEVAHKIANKREALRRQIQYIGKVLRTEDIEAIQKTVDKLNNKHQQLTHATLKLRQTCEELVAIGDEKVNELIELHPKLDRQKLRQLIRQINKLSKQGNTEKVSEGLNNLYAYLKPICLV